MAPLFVLERKAVIRDSWFVVREKGVSVSVNTP